MNQIDGGIALARITLNITSATLNALAEALYSRNLTHERQLEIRQVLIDAAKSQAVAFEALVEAERLNAERYVSMQEEIRALNRQLNYIIER